MPRSIHERAREVPRSLAGTPAFERSRRGRKRIEMLFAQLKRILRLGRLRLRSGDLFVPDKRGGISIVRADGRTERILAKNAPELDASVRCRRKTSKKIVR